MEEANERIKKIIQIIEKAQKLQGSFEKKNQILNEALATAQEDAPSGGTMLNKAGVLQPEDAYKYKLASLYYDIRYYEEALKINEDLYKNSEDGNFAKNAGDCLRHLSKFDDALGYYKKGLDFCQIQKNQELKNSILNSEGLTYICLGKYDNAIEKYKLAIQSAKRNPLYYCNLGGAYLRKGERQNANINYLKAQQIVNNFSKSDEQNQGLTKNNITFIKKQLNNFLNLLTKLLGLKSNSKVGNERLNSRINGIGSLFSLSLLDSNKSKDKIIQIQVDAIENNNKILEELDKTGNENLKLFYDGMQHTLALSYHAAQTVESEVATLQTGSKVGAIASKLATFLPVIGDTLSSAIDFADNFISVAYIKKRSCNISQMATDSRRFNDLSEDVVLRVINSNRDLLNKAVPQGKLLPQWLNRFENFAKKVNNTIEQISTKIYGSRYPTPMQKYGHNVATELQNYISSGELYGKQIAALVKDEAKKKRLISKAEEILKNDAEGKSQRKKLPMTSGVSAAEKDKTENKTCNDCAIY